MKKTTEEKALLGFMVLVLGFVFLYLITLSCEVYEAYFKPEPEPSFTQPQTNNAEKLRLLDEKIDFIAKHALDEKWYCRYLDELGFYAVIGGDRTRMAGFLSGSKCEKYLEKIPEGYKIP